MGDHPINGYTHTHVNYTSTLRSVRKITQAYKIEDSYGGWTTLDPWRGKACQKGNA